VPEAEPMYNLKAVILQTGIPAASLRAWERRYSIPTPVRKPNGHRVYPRSEVEKLLKIKELMAGGMTVSQAVNQLEHAPTPVPAAGGEVERLGAQLAQALEGLDTVRTQQVLGQVLEMLPLEQVVLRIIRPLLPTLAPFGRTFLRFKLGAWLAHTLPPAGAPVALVMAPDPLDLRPLLVAVLLSRRGRRVVYVEGAEAPAGLEADLVIDPRRWREGVPPEQLFE
jgi:MerR family transcriptional regulator, light-induced transcriptional regulator